MIVHYRDLLLAASYARMRYEASQSLEAAILLRDELEYRWHDAEVVAAMSGVIGSVSIAIDAGTIEIHHARSLSNIVVLAQCLIDNLDELAD